MEAETEKQRDVAAVPRLSLRPAEAAAALGVGRTALWEMTVAGDVPHVRIGKSVRYPVDGLKRWLNEKTM